MSTIYSIEQIVVAINNIDAKLANPSSAKEARALTSAHTYWTNMLKNKSKAEVKAAMGGVKTVAYTEPVATKAAPVQAKAKATSKVYSDQLPRENGEKENKSMEHVYGFDPKTGIQHEAGDTAFYMVRMAKNAKTDKGRDSYLKYANKGFNLVDEGLTDTTTGELPPMVEVLKASLAQFAKANPRTMIPVTLKEATQETLDAITRKFHAKTGRVATMAEVFYVLAIKDNKPGRKATSK